MSNRGLATGVFRAWGIMWSVYALVSAPQFLLALLRDPYGSDQTAMRQFAIGSNAISLGCQIVISAFLILKSTWLAELVFPVEQPTGIAISSRDLQAILFSAIGLYFLLTGISSLAVSGYQLLTRPRGDDRNAFAYLWQRTPQELVTGLVETAAGAYVLFGRDRGPWKGLRAIHERFFGL